MLDEAFVEELRGWLTVNSGKIVKVEKPRKKTQAIQGILTAVIPFLISSSNAVIVKVWAFVFSMHCLARLMAISASAWLFRHTSA